MNYKPIRTVAIAGAGTMGSGIALVCAQAEYQVIVYDIGADMLKKAKTAVQNSLKKLIEIGKLDQTAAIAVEGRIQYSNVSSDVKADLVIEAIVEKAEIKIALFRELMEINGPDSIYASNTSSIPITQIAAALPYQTNFLGIHFFNPAQIMKLVEVIKGAKTNEDLLKHITSFVKSLNKTPVIAADAPGFIVNRVARLYYVEALKIMEEGVCNFDTIDKIMEASGFKMGPFRLMDLIGVDTNYSVTESQYRLFNFESRFKPSRIQKQKVDAGLHGRKTKEGFYTYE